MTYTLEVDDRVLEATEEQTAIIDYALAHPGLVRLLINSLAGSAKTSTLRFLCKYMPKQDILSLAFNKRIADEMQKVLPNWVKAATINSVGHRTWSPVVGRRLVLDTKKNYNIVKSIIDNLPRHERNEAYDNFADLTKTLSRAKLAGYVPKAATMGHSLISQDDFFGGLEEPPDDWFIEMVDKALLEGIKQAYGALIDFDDQIYMPTLFGGSFPYYKTVMVDEYQDFSPLNHAMLDRLVREDTSLIGVGDPWQSIYAFRGADTQSMARARERFNMHEMTLSVSFRCPIAGVKNAHWRVPHMKWPAWAIEGQVLTRESWDAQTIPDNSAIICRNNAPLLSMALRLLKSGRGVHLVGTDLGPSLVRTMKKLGDLSMKQEAVYAAIDAWEADKIRRSRSPDAITDKAECLRVFAGYGPTLGAAIAYCERIFQARGAIQLLSGHKAKGLEWDTVYHLDPHRVPSPYAKEGESLEQEYNVKYVIETRFKRELHLVRLDQFEGDD